jgi:hypothetical protein
VAEADRLNMEVEVDKRVELLIESTCYVVFAYVAQGLFERHKLIVATQVGAAGGGAGAKPQGVKKKTQILATGVL